MQDFMRTAAYCQVSLRSHTAFRDKVMLAWGD